MVAHRAGRGLALYAGALAATAYLGVAGLALGFLPGTDELRPRLPFDSTLFGAVALLCVVAVPTTATAVLAWRHDPRASRASLLAGVALVGWIVVEVLVVGELSPFHPVYLLLGLGLAGWGWPARLHDLNVVDRHLTR